MAPACQVDFYVLTRPTQSAGQLACRLAMMAWEQGHRVLVRVSDDEQARRLDELMWDFPPGRFLPHDLGTESGETPVSIVRRDDVIPEHRDLVVNLDTEPVPQPDRFRRLCEIVPAAPAQRTASREKYRIYRGLGLEPETHEMVQKR